MWRQDDLDSFASQLYPDDEVAQARAREELLSAAASLRDAQDELRRSIAETSIACLRGFLGDQVCEDLDRHLREQTPIVIEKVHAEQGRWQIDLIDNEYIPIAETKAGDPFSVLCLSPGFIAAIAEMSGFGETVVTTRRWVNRYGAGDSITPHDDTTGDFQVMICTTAPPGEYGGALVFENGTEATLQRGDLLVMRHADLVHWTTPLRDDVPSPRATATCRYYVEGGRLPRSRVYDHSLVGPKTGNRKDA
ncbi:2OG-Fe(II) oxygenase [Micromonospora sp. DT62]|uniref:2OG-Fe(II) oxygenase n=1 Tax=Micromonospora sp. DT62 TaxID=3416521 RepID=UPI003CED3B1F